MWKTIFERYEVSDDGVIRNKESKKILKTFINDKGYEIVSLWLNGKDKKFRVHRLVADAFISNPENKAQINHIDGNKLNNRADNLEWSTHSENIMHRYYSLRLGLMRKVRCIETGLVYKSQKQAERLTGINAANISSCCTHRPKYITAGGYHWEFVDTLVKEMVGDGK